MVVCNDGFVWKILLFKALYAIILGSKISMKSEEMVQQAKVPATKPKGLLHVALTFTHTPTPTNQSTNK